MSFLDLTPTWTDQPLTAPDVAANVVDLMLTLGDRHRGTFSILLCDPDDHYRATISVDLPQDHPWPPHPAPPDRPIRRTPPGAALDPAAPDPGAALDPGAAPDPGSLCANALHPLVPAIQTAPDTGVILALGRPGPARSPALDNQWAQAATTICQAADLRLLGFYIATRDGIYQPLTNQPISGPAAVGESAVDRPRVGRPSAA
ncbi:hypothetical protein [Kribbella jiaozuonensis]|uniref:Uncharacterized protein n=1 Tax=Kribbella jiaozuonensis TaxID=2575441 RepID=A0A4U3LN95_9ACTN|nr:hypothetical protein [Kribbella jiaozuonensis]TKK76594.1 hypothetical protein FDA38_29975 [Kribbella jiaozuonensis]